MKKATIRLTSDQRSELEVLRQSDKFAEDPASFYPGAPSKEIQQIYESHANTLISRVLALPDTFDKSNLMEIFRDTLEEFDRADTEDRERIGVVCERIMDVLNVASSDGALNQWLYGFDPNDVALDV